MGGCSSWCPPCQRFTPNLIDVYNELSDKGDFEIVYISADEDKESYNDYFSKMPWLAVPFFDTKTREALDGCSKVSGMPHLVFIDEKYRSQGYPFTPEWVKEIKDMIAGDNRNVKDIIYNVVFGASTGLTYFRMAKTQEAKRAFNRILIQTR
ncbi:C1-like protein [Artemisia annua]|uniref:protein-disulfide reductase n=1 Tax=Artemisia annua TaxID=35608 RepID=A0A2U1KE75_ARTAN|nr:C1-like protein [Artemisia annua]